MKKIGKYILLFLTLILMILPITILAIEAKNEDIGVIEGHINSLETLVWHEKSDLSDEGFSIPKKLTGKVYENKTIYAKLDLKLKSDYCLGFKSFMQSVEVKLDGELIYTYNNENTRDFGKGTPSSFHIIDLPDDSYNKTISITINTPYERNVGLFGDIYVGPKLAIIQYIYAKYLPRTIMACVLLVVDIALLCASFLFLKQKSKFRKAIFQFIAVGFIAIYFISTGMLTNVFLAPGVNLTILFYSLMLFTLFLSIYFYEKTNRRYKKLFIGYFGLTALNIIISTILHVTAVCDLYQTVLITGIIIVILFVTDLVISIKDFKKNVNAISTNKRSRFAYFLLDIIITFTALIFFALEYFSHYSSKYFDNIPLCLVFLINICMVYGYLAYSIAQDSKNSYVYKAELQETKTYLVQSQMKPHFIFNTLGAIRAMINSNPKKAYDLTTSFSKYLRANIGDISYNELIPFSKELDHVKAYLDIELERFRGRLNVEFDIQASDFNINPLTVEPLVENAVKHGVCKRIEGGTVKIKSYDTETCHVIEVIDDGVGFDIEEYKKKRQENKSVGIKYIKYRVEKMGGDFKIESQPGVGTVARICIKK